MGIDGLKMMMKAIDGERVVPHDTRTAAAGT